MREIFTVLASICIAFSATAQRHVDIAITKISFPTNKSTIKSDTNFPLAVNLKNNGPDSVKATDTIYIYLGSNGIVDTTLPRLEIMMTFIPTDSTITLLDNSGNALVNATMHWSGYVSDSFKSFCATALIRSAAINPAVDPNLLNNTNCADSVHMLDINNYLLSKKTAISVYPIPAQSEINFSLQLVNDAYVIIKLFDLLGRNILSMEKGKLNAGTYTIPVSVGGLKNGMYLYQVQIDDNIQTGRLSIAK